MIPMIRENWFMEMLGAEQVTLVGVGVVGGVTVVGIVWCCGNKMLVS